MDSIELSLLMLIVYVLWAVVLSLVVATWQMRRVMVQEGSAEAITAQNEGSPFNRAQRAHLNAMEQLPLFASLVLLEALLDTGSPLFGQLTMVVVAARLCQSFVHFLPRLRSTIAVAFIFFLVQMMITVLMGVDIVYDIPQLGEGPAPGLDSF